MVPGMNYVRRGQGQGSRASEDRDNVNTNKRQSHGYLAACISVYWNAYRVRNPLGKTVRLSQLYICVCVRVSNRCPVLSAVCSNFVRLRFAGSPPVTSKQTYDSSISVYHIGWLLEVTIRPVKHVAM